ncbi:MAG: hypothetical protein WCT77_00315 [Bacteroidota bacterium]|jgi:hypothetical protein
MSDSSTLKSTYQGSVTGSTLTVPNGYTTLYLVNDGTGDVTIVNSGTGQTFTLKPNEWIRDGKGYYYGCVCTVPAATVLRYRYQL